MLFFFYNVLVIKEFLCYRGIFIFLEYFFCVNKLEIMFKYLIFVFVYEIFSLN